jgi:hypothetical protein
VHGDIRCAVSTTLEELSRRRRHFGQRPIRPVRRKPGVVAVADGDVSRTTHGKAEHLASAKLGLFGGVRELLPIESIRREPDAAVDGQEEPAVGADQRPTRAIGAQDWMRIGGCLCPAVAVCRGEQLHRTVLYIYRREKPIRACCEPSDRLPIRPGVDDHP